jgi:hypothetical protein
LVPAVAPRFVRPEPDTAGVADFLTITVDDAERFPVGTQVGLYRANEVVGDVVPFARAIDVKTVDIHGRAVLTTPVPAVRSYGRGAGTRHVPDHTPFAVAARVNGQARVIRVMAEHA